MRMPPKHGLMVSRRESITKTDGKAYRSNQLELYRQVSYWSIMGQALAIINVRSEMSR